MAAAAAGDTARLRRLLDVGAAIDDRDARRAQPKEADAEGEPPLPGTANTMATACGPLGG